MKDAQTQLEAHVLSNDISLFALSPMTLPFFSGERSTGWHTEARGSMHGLSLDTSSVHILYSIYEGVALRISKVQVQFHHNHGRYHHHHYNHHHNHHHNYSHDGSRYLQDPVVAP
jgi:sugar (pentulose or hexulose) kinase